MERSVIFDVPVPASNSKVTSIELKHPALHYFLVEIFDIFPNLQRIEIDFDGVAVLPQRAFRNANNLAEFEVYNSEGVSTIDPNVFNEATRLERLS